MKVLYFAWLKEKTGVAEEEYALPDGVSTVMDLIEHMKGRSPAFADAFDEENSVRVAVNHEHVERTHAITDGDEVAFFPPVTGG